MMLGGIVPPGLVLSDRLSIDPNELTLTITQDNLLDRDAAALCHGNALKTLFSHGSISGSARALEACRILNFIERRIRVSIVDPCLPGHEPRSPREVPAYTPFLRHLPDEVESIAIEMVLAGYLKTGYFSLEMPHLVTSWVEEFAECTPAQSLLEHVIEKRLGRMIECFLDLGATLERIPHQTRTVKTWTDFEVRVGDTEGFINVIYPEATHPAGSEKSAIRNRLLNTVMTERMRREINRSTALESGSRTPAPAKQPARRRML